MHKIEALVDTKLAEHSLEESEVMTGITKVYTARRVATMKLAELNGFDDQMAARKARWRLGTGQPAK